MREKRRSIQEIQEILQNHNAVGVFMQYEKGTGRIENLSFQMDFSGTMINFKMPIKWHQAQKVLEREGNPRANDEDYW